MVAENGVQNLPSQIASADRFILIYACIGYDRYQIVISRYSNTPFGRYGTGNLGGPISWSSWKEL